MSTLDILDDLGRRLDADAGRLARLDAYYAGTQPLAYLSEAAREALGAGFRTLAVGFPRLAVDALAERLQIIGFRHGAADDADLWRVWTANSMDVLADVAHVEALTLGRSFVIVWAGPEPATPRVSVESAREVTVTRDPASRTVTAALKRWRDPADAAGVPGREHSIVYEPDRITRYVTDTPGAPVTAQRVVDTIANPLGVVPVVPVVNRGRLLDTDGVSEMAPLLDLADALNKAMSDAMVTSEYYSRPRRWATGIEVDEDDDGNPVNPFASESNRVWTAEPPDAKFGQFAGSGLNGYAELVATITAQLGALSALPAHYLGVHGDQPASADAIRSAEASLVAKASARQRVFGQAWADVAALMAAVRDGVAPAERIGIYWANPETRTPAQTADAVTKLVQAGILPTTEALARLGYTPAEIDRIRTARRADALDTAGLDVAELAQ